MQKFAVVQYLQSCDDFDGFSWDAIDTYMIPDDDLTVEDRAFLKKMHQYAPKFMQPDANIDELNRLLKKKAEKKDGIELPEGAVITHICQVLFP